MDPPNPVNHFYGMLREKYKTEIRKAQNTSLFSFKRLAFQTVPASPASEKPLQTQKTETILNEILIKLSKKLPEDILLENLIFLRKQTSDQPSNNLAIIYLLRTGFLELLYAFMQDFFSYEQFVQDELLWICCNISYLNSKEIPLIKRDRLVGLLKKCLFSKYHKQTEMVLWTLNNLADDDSECREAVVREGILLVIRDKIANTNVINVDILKNFLITLHAISKDEKGKFLTEVILI